MLRKSVRVSSRLALSAAISWTLIPIAVADAPSTPTSNSAAAEASVAPAKRLFTVPEDGMGDKRWLSGATRFVREILAKRPNEDLVICIAGCVGKQDRVVYAQPAEVSPPNDQVSDADADTDAAPAAANKSEFVPTMAKPQSQDAPANADATEGTVVK